MNCQERNGCLGLRAVAGLLPPAVRALAVHHWGAWFALVLVVLGGFFNPMEVSANINRPGTGNQVASSPGGNHVSSSPHGGEKFIKIDPATLALVSGMNSLLQCLVFGVLWRLNRSLSGIRCWAASALLNALALPLYSLRDLYDAPLLTMLLPTVFTLTAGALFLAGAARLCNREIDWRPPAILTAILFAGYVWFLLVDNSLRYRPIFTSANLFLLHWLGARILFSESRIGLRLGTRVCGVGAGILCLVMLIRGIALPLQATPATLFSQATPQIVTFVGTTIWVLLWTFGGILLINQHHILAGEVAHQEKLVAEAARFELMQALAEERAQAQRHEFVRDLHDGLGGLTTHLMQCLAAESHPGGPSTGGRNRPELLGCGISREDCPRQEPLARLGELAVAGNSELRNLMNHLESGCLHWPDLLYSLHDYAKKTTTCKQVELNWRVSGPLPPAPLEIPLALSLSRAVKEAVNNLVRHSGATRATLVFAFRPNTLILFIRDNGCGLGGLGEGAGQGRGWRNMRRRTEELGGRLVVSEVSGTRLLFTLPLPLASTHAPSTIA